MLYCLQKDSNKQFSFWLKVRTVLFNKKLAHTFEPKVGQMFVHFFPVNISHIYHMFKATRFSIIEYVTHVL